MDNNLPWIEKYRPQNLSDIIGQDNIITCVRKLLENGSFPHMLFYGAPGSGKTSTILAILNEYYGKNKKLCVLKLDASDDRGINSVREEIKGFAEKKNYFNNGIKIIILDEADNMTYDAQFALRRIIEKYSKSTRFCLICNYENKIIGAIKSRCAEFKFTPIKNEKIVERLNDIINKEKLNISEDHLKIINELSSGDLRKAINLLQIVSNYKKNSNIYFTLGYPNINEKNYILELLLNDNYDFTSANNKLSKNILDRGYSIKTIFEILLLNIDILFEKLPMNRFAYIFSKLSTLQVEIDKTNFENINISVLVSIFKDKGYLNLQNYNYMED